MEPITLITTIGGVCGAIATIIALLTLICKPLRSKFAKWVNKTANTDEFNKKFDDINAKLDNLAELVEKTIEQNDKLQEELNKQSEALKASLRNSILKTYYCCQKQGYITTYQLQNVTELYNNYKNLRGNSFVSHLVEDVLSNSSIMPIRDNEGGDSNNYS